MAKNDYRLGQAQIRNGGKGPMRVAEKPKDFKSAVVKLLKYISRNKKGLIIAFSCSVSGVVLQLFGPDNLNKITNIIDDGMQRGAVDLPSVIRLSVITVFLYLFSSLLTYTQGRVLVKTAQTIMHRMREDISRKLNRIPLKRFDSTSFGDLLSRVTNDVDTVGMSLNHSLSDIVSAMATFIGCMIMMLKTNWLLTMIAVVCAAGGFFVMNTIIKRSQKYFSRRQRYLGEINGHIEEVYAGHVIVKAYNGEGDSRREFDRLNRLLYENNWKSQFISGIMPPMMEFLGNLGYVAVCVAGAVMVKNGMIRFGVVVAFILYVKMFTQPMSMVAQAATEIQSAAAASERVFGFLAEEEMEDEKGKTAVLMPEDCRGEIEFSHVSFGYVPERTIIRDFSVKVKPGQKVAIVGPTGAGKTTLVNLLMRFYEIGDGSITIDGISTKDITRENVHALFCMVLQDTWMFEGSIKENIIYSKKGARDEDVIRACKAVGLHSFISSLPAGYDTVLSDDSNLSAGQRQLITIARAMVEDAPLLILDEATSSVDTRTEQVVQNAMDKLTEGRTSFTIAHRLSTIRNADMILVMKDGDIVETGTHDELLAKGGFYSTLWTSQFVNAETI